MWSHVPSRPAAAEARASGSLSRDGAKHSSGCRRRAQSQLDYRRDTVRVAFRNATAVAGERQRYTVCYTRNRCSPVGAERYEARPWDAWRLRIVPPWAGFVKGRYRRYLEFAWRTSGRLVARKRVWIYRARLRLAGQHSALVGADKSISISVGAAYARPANPCT
jgi:hypothetical protein